MNIITKSDIKKFVKLLQAGIAEGERKELSTYSSAVFHDGILVIKSYYIDLQCRFYLSKETVDRLLEEEHIDDEIRDLLSGLQ